jgi:hypothetical protein
MTSQSTFGLRALITKAPNDTRKIPIYLFTYLVHNWPILSLSCLAILYSTANLIVLHLLIHWFQSATIGLHQIYLDHFLFYWYWKCHWLPV